MHPRILSVAFLLVGLLPAQTPTGQIRWLDLEGDTPRQTAVHRIPRQYLGHPTTTLLADGKTMLCVHPKGHGRGAIVLQRSDDAGLSWTEPLPVPENWSTSMETPTIHRVIDPRDGTERLVLFSGLYPIRSSVSADNGVTWTPLAPIGQSGGQFGGIVAMASVVRLANGDYGAYFHDDGRFFREDGKRSQFTVYQTLSSDGGLTWRAPTVVWTGTDLDLCEPGIVRSPDGKLLAMLLRENSRKQPAHICFSDDEAVTWSKPVPMPTSLMGDRHTGAYAPDGRLLFSFRDMATDSPTRGDWVVWVGTFDDLVAGRDGQYRVRLSRNWRGTDCAYPGVEVLADGTFVMVTYGYWEPGEEPFVRAVRLRLTELDELAKGPVPTFDRPPGTVHPTARVEEWWTKRVASDLEAAKAGGHQVLFVGDSITQGWDSTGREVWDELFVPRKSLNLGVSGDRTQNVLWRLDQGLLAALAAPASDIKVSVVMIGTNNASRGECTPEEIAQGVSAVTHRLLHGLPGSKVLLLAVFPRGAKEDAASKRCVAANELLAAEFVGNGRVVWKDIATAFVAPGEAIDKAVMPDLLHLSKPAYRTWADAILADLDALR